MTIGTGQGTDNGHIELIEPVPSSSGSSTGTTSGSGQLAQLKLNPQANTSLGTFSSLMQPWSQTFTAPTVEQARATPGYQFALQEGENALQASAAAKGNLLTGGTLTALNNYAQNAADTNYQNVYNNALNAYQTNYNTWSNNQNNTYNRLASLAGLGQTSAQQRR